MALLCALIAAALTAYMLYTLLFGSRAEFIECVRFWFSPELLSLLRGQWHDELWAELKLALWLGGSALVGFGVYQALT